MSDLSDHPSPLGHSLPEIASVMDQLLSPDGCPWDKGQTLESLRPYVIEEAHEVVEAIDSGEPELLREELGDLLFQVVFQAALAQRKKWFDLDGVVSAIRDKMIRRHPWVFGDETAEDMDNSPEGALTRWEAIKAEERKSKPVNPKKGGALGGVPAALSALLRALRVGEKAAAVGFDWPDAAGAREKLNEELGELDEALAEGDQDAAEAELGDVLFSVVNLARKHGLDPEAALRRSLNTFSERFRHAELAAGDAGLNSLSAAQLDELWNAAKRAE